MDFDFSPDQRLLLTSIEAMLARFKQPDAGAHGYVQYSAELQSELTESGFLEVASQPDYGLLEAALLIEEVAACPVSAEAAASSLIGPLITTCASPIALTWSLGAPARYLNVARTVCWFRDDAVIVGELAPDDIDPVDGVVAYPLAALKRAPRKARQITGELAAAIERRALIGIAAEAAGLMRGALQQTVQYAKDRQLFGQRLAQFQAVQHRLAEDAQLTHSAKMLALRAAYQDDDASAALACLFAQDVMRKVIYDCHQFTGAIGLTLEYPLHLWTYRLKYLQGEAGGRAEQARLFAQRTWPQTQNSPRAARSAASVGFGT